MSNYFGPAIGITVFIVFFSAALITGSVTQNYAISDNNVSKEDLSFSPNLPDVNPKKINLKEDVVDSDNVNITNSSNLNYTRFKSDYIVTPKNTSKSAWVVYRLDGTTSFLTTEATRYGFLLPSNIDLEEYDTADTNDSPLETTSLNSRQTLDLQSGTNFVRVKFDPSSDRVYNLIQKEEEQKGLLATISAYLASAAEALGAWFSLITSLPPILWMVLAVISIIGLLIVLEVVLW